MAYKIGFCPQCGTQIMVQNFDGRWNSTKSNYRQAEIEFENGHRIRTIICKDCLEHPDMDKLMGAICSEDSRASNPETLEYLRKLEKPKGISRHNPVFVDKLSKQQVKKSTKESNNGR